MRERRVGLRRDLGGFALGELVSVFCTDVVLVCYVNLNNSVRRGYS